MSGRLIITTKKTYCPWNQQNVERVLRDERLERERIEKEAQLERDAAKARRRGELGGTAAADGEGLKHVNLFPEAEEAELRLARGISGKTTEKKGDNGIMPVPLGGEEAANRKAGSVPFYMQRGKSDNSSSYNQMRVLGRKVEADAITAKIMNDQACSREESRKSKNDPMIRLYISGECNVSGRGGDKLTRDIRTDTVQEVEYVRRVGSVRVDCLQDADSTSMVICEGRPKIFWISRWRRQEQLAAAPKDSVIRTSSSHPHCRAANVVNLAWLY